MFAASSNFWHGFFKRASEDPLQIWEDQSEEASRKARHSQKDHNRRVDLSDSGEMASHDAFYRY